MRLAFVVILILISAFTVGTGLMTLLSDGTETTMAEDYGAMSAMLWLFALVVINPILIVASFVVLVLPSDNDSRFVTLAAVVPILLSACGLWIALRGLTWI